MHDLNYSHLHYFWAVARDGSIAAACKRLHVTQPTISGQLRTLERSLGEKLFARVGRGLELTDAGRTVFRYADEIFALGGELVEALRGSGGGRPAEARIGVADALPKLIVYRLLQPAMHLEEPIRLVCVEGKPDDLLAQLAVHRLDAVLSDTPIPSGVHVRAFSHLLGESAVSVFAARAHVEEHRSTFPDCLHDVPWLLPTRNTALRRLIDGWFENRSMTPTVAAEFEDSALIKVFGQAGAGVFPAPSVIQDEIQRQYDVAPIGEIDGIRERFYAISAERRVKNPAVLAITETARRDLFRGPDASTGASDR